jgi:hypothetical protein
MDRRIFSPVLALAATVGMTFVLSPARGSLPRAWVTSQRSGAAHQVVYPLKISKNRRYLVDERNRPFMIVGDSPQALIGNLSVQEASAYIANRKAHGFNALWVNLLCVKYTGCQDDGATYDGIKPFTTPGDLATPNPAYFARAETMVRLAAAAGMVVFLDPIETGGWLGVLRRNGATKARDYGRFVGRRFRMLRNIVWMSGNDFQTWTKPADDALVLAVAKGIRSVDRAHLQTIELSYPDSGSLDDARWRSAIQLDAAYTSAPTYARVLKEYGRKLMPVFMVEAGYEFEQNSPSFSKGDPGTLRRQEYWTALSGSTGQFYGSRYTWPFPAGWKDHLNTPGATQIAYLIRLLAGRRWFDLVPDRAHKVVTEGYGQFSTTGNVDSSDYVTTAATRDGRLAISYLPDGGKIRVDMRRLAKRVKARWYDPTNGTYIAVPGSPFRNSGRVDFTPPAKNAGGDHDWVLVLSTQ